MGNERYWLADQHDGPPTLGDRLMAAAVWVCWIGVAACAFMVFFAPELVNRPGEPFAVFGLVFLWAGFAFRDKP